MAAAAHPHLALSQETVFLHTLLLCSRPPLASLAQGRAAGVATALRCIACLTGQLIVQVLFEMQYCGTDADVWSCGVALYVLLTGQHARPGICRPCAIVVLLSPTATLPRELCAGRH